MTKTYRVGDRVRVAITRPDDWATGSAAKLTGAVGTVESVKPANDPRGWRPGPPDVPYLVRFDVPVASWHSNGSPHAAFHFDAHDLEAIS